MKIKRPSVRGMSNVSYLGRFQKDKFIQDGHNTGPEKLTMGKENEDLIKGGGSGGGSGKNPLDVLRAMNDFASRNRMNTRSNEYMLKDRSPEGISKRVREMHSEMENELFKRWEKSDTDADFSTWAKIMKAGRNLKK